MIPNRLNARPTPGKTPVCDPLTRAHWQGWEDARCGRGFHSAYDSWPPRHQLSYELARQRCVATVLAHGGRPRRWLKKETLSEHAACVPITIAITTLCPENFFFDKETA